jgi:hypothetical protein
MRLALLLAASLPALAQSGPAQSENDFFEKRIRPVLTERCAACHSTSPQANLRVTSRQSLLKGGDSGPAIVPGIPEESRLFQAVSYRDQNLRMPPTGKLSDEVIDDFRQWILSGAPDPRTEEPVKPVTSGIDWEKARKFWAFLPLSPSASSIDAILKPAGKVVPDNVWLRRVTYDLTGLPPIPQALDAFLRRPDKAAAIDRLLASPQYGERWARHWLDLVRYAETNGHEYDNDKNDAWRYRDYVIRAFNDDLPYNQFVREHIAGDLLPGARLSKDGSYIESPLATTSWWFGEILNSATDSVKSRADQVDNQIDVFSKTFLGLTVACARCHDHKFDPIPTADYYALAGVMHSTRVREAVIDSPQRQAEIAKTLQRYAARPVAVAPKLQLREGEELFSGFGTWHREGQGITVSNGVADTAGPGALAAVGSLTSEKFKMPRFYVHVLLQGTKYAKPRLGEGDLRLTLVADDYKSSHFFASGDEGFTWKTERMTLSNGRTCYFELVDRSRTGYLAVAAIVISDHKDPPAIVENAGVAPFTLNPELEAQMPASTFAMISHDEDPANARLHIRGNHQNLGPEVPRGFLQILSRDRKPIENTSGRLQFADWLTSDAETLLARVMVNRVWMHHFGTGLVSSTDNFGVMGNKPANQQLLDTLAQRFVAGGWSLKKLHREILLTDAFAKTVPIRRLEGEAIRDAMLQLSGRLDSTLYGPSVVPYISKYQDGRGKPPGGPLDANGRRSIYIQVRRNFLTPMFLAFDYPLPISTIGTRGSSAVPSQALMLLNNEFVLEQARLWAKRTLDENRRPADLVRSMYLEAFSRAPAPAEQAAALDYLHQHGDSEATRADLAHVLFNTAEFSYVQ